METIIKQFTPRGLLNSARGIRNWLGLVTQSRQNFDCKNLRFAETLRLASIFKNEAIGIEWEKDHEVIKKVYGDQDVMGGVNPGDRRALYYLVIDLRPESVLEVGTHIGASTLYIARALMRINHGRRMTSVDIIDVNDPELCSWKHLGLAKPPREFARELQCLDRIDFQTGSSLDLLRRAKQTYDLVFLDGNHSARAVYREVSAALTSLKPGGVIVLHDYHHQGKPLYPDGDRIDGPYHALERVR